MFYEVIYEDGTHSVMNVENPTEALAGIKEQHRRAMSGEPAYAGDGGLGRAVRVKRVLMYDRHPSEFRENQIVSKDEVQAAVRDLLKKEGDDVDLPEFLSELRGLTGAMVDSGAHETNYKMPETGEVDSKEWEDVSDAK